jgi:hypothetical protein
VPHVARADGDAKRETPDYDGRGNEDADAGSWALWIPRIILSPLYVVNEYLLRKPLGALVTKAEHDRWINTITNLFTFGPNGNYIIIPTALFDFGLLPSVGVYYEGDDSIVKGNSMRLHVATWGPEWISATFVERYQWNEKRSTLEARALYTREADLLFFGIGPDVTDKHQSRYGLQTFDTSASFRQSLGGESMVAITAGQRTVGYRQGNCCNDPTIDDEIAVGNVASPPGLDVDYTSLYQRLDLTLDTRDPRPAPASGGYLQTFVESDLDRGNKRAWLKLGGTLGLAFDLGNQRTVKVQGSVEYVDPTEGDVVPFNELASMTSDQMPAFVGGWMIGRSTIAAQVGYVWPVWLWLDGQLRFAMGNAFGAHLEDVSLKQMRLSGDIGVTTIGKRDAGFEILFGLGTETFEQGGHLTSVRITFGSRRGF